MDISYTIYENWLTGAKSYFIAYSASPVTEEIAPGKYQSYSTYSGRLEVDKDMAYLGSHETKDKDAVAPETFLTEYSQSLEKLKSVSGYYFKQ